MKKGSVQKQTAYRLGTEFSKNWTNYILPALSEEFIRREYILQLKNWAYLRLKLTASEFDMIVLPPWLPLPFFLAFCSPKAVLESH